MQGGWGSGAVIGMDGAGNWDGVCGRGYGWGPSGGMPLGELRHIRLHCLREYTSAGWPAAAQFRCHSAHCHRTQPSSRGRTEQEAAHHQMQSDREHRESAAGSRWGYDVDEMGLGWGWDGVGMGLGWGRDGIGKLSGGAERNVRCHGNTTHRKDRKSTPDHHGKGFRAARSGRA